MVHIFGGNPLDRVGPMREDAAWLEAQLGRAEARTVVFWNGRPLVTGESRLAMLETEAARALGGGEVRPAFLGMWEGAPVFALELGEASEPAPGAPAPGRFEELRAAALALPGPEAGIAATAKSLFDWRRRHRFCAACGAASEEASGGWRRVCPACGAEHFPRVDPVVIMLPVYGDRCLLGRNVGWPEGRMSALAGFMEPGESIEQACAREMREEAGLTAVRVTYHSSQPWPFPSSLMIGLVAEVADDRVEPDGVELVEVRWLTRDEARGVLEGRHPEVRPLGPLGIAAALFASWVEESRG